MTNTELIEMVHSDLESERKHLAFYTYASTMVQGLHRSELREFFEKEAASELQHVLQFSELIIHLGGTPGVFVNYYPEDLSCPVAILKYIVEMEDEVADIYAGRLRATDGMETAATAYCHVFYENQIEDSWRTAREVEQMVKHYEKESCHAEKSP